jgi:prepilin-type N-terminal cleavage/methylation domain-containing protein
MIIKHAGFTLIELLISVTLLALLMLVGTYSYSVFTNKWQDELGQFSVVNRQATNFQRIQILLNNISPLAVRKDNGQPGFFLVGDNTRLLGITYNGLFTMDKPEVFRLSVSKNDDQTFELLYQAKPLIDSTVVSASQEITFTNNIVLLDNLDEISFRYLGWPHFTDADSSANTSNISSPIWSSSYSALDSQIMPEKIALFIRKEDREITFNIALSLNSARWMSHYWDEVGL